MNLQFGRGKHMVEGHRKKVELKVSGMTCTSCATTIEKSLSSLSGVTNA